MKLAALMMLVTCLQVSARTFSQKVTIQMKNASLEKVFSEIKSQTGLYAIWDEQALLSAKPVDVSVRDASVQDLLNQCFANQPLTYSIVGKMIVVKKKMVVPAPPSISPLVLYEAPRLTISGVVLDEQGKPIANASVQVKGTKTGIATGNDGSFKLSVADNKVVLIVTSLGYEKQEITVSNDEPIRIVLKKSEKEMDQVVVTTGIFNRKSSSYTGAVTVVTRKELQMAGNRNLITSLRNIDPSFNIIESNNFGSNPNRLPEIQVRGNSSLPNVNQLQDQTRVGINTPLVVLDGFETTLQRLLDLNENEVETITLLKDASATAIYGSRGANGVVVVKTRAPQQGKLRVSYKGDVTVELPDITGYNLLKSREKLELERLAGLYSHTNPSIAIPLERYYNNIYNDINAGVETDWISKPLRTGVGNRHNLRLEGGDDRFRYSASAQINNIEGVMKGSSRKMFNGAITLSYVFKSLRFTNNLIIGLGKNQESPYGNFSDYVKQNPYWRAYDEGGKPLRVLGYYGNNDYVDRWGTTLPGNPLYNASLNTFNRGNTSELINNFSLEWRFHPDLVFRGSLGLRRETDERDIFKPAAHTDFNSYTGSDIFRKGSYRFNTGKNQGYEGALNISYNRSVNKHTIFGGLDYRISQRTSSAYGFEAEGFTNPNFDFISMAQQYKKDGKPDGSESLTRTIGITGNASYMYDGKYSVDVAGRVDGASQFGAKNRFAPFWSAGLGWNMEREPWLADKTYINRLKLRGSVGMTGSQKFNAYQALSTYKYYTDNRYYNWVGSYLMGFGNENLKWQQKMNYNIGLEGNFLNNRLNFVADYYIETTQGMISAVDLPASNGFSSYIDNIGKIENRGIELKVTIGIIRSKDFSWSINGALVHNKNKILKISEALKEAQKGMESQKGAIPTTLYKEGYSDRTIWVVPSLGIDPSTGKEMYLDRFNNTTFVWNSQDIRATGVETPKVMGNFGTLVRYKGFTANLIFGYRFGGQAYNQTLIQKVENADFKWNVDERVFRNRWQKPGDNAAFKGLLVVTPTERSSRFVQNENVLQCQNINLSYEIRNKALLNKLGASFLSAGFNFSDLFYISSINRERGIDYPFSRQCSFTLNVTF
ncbi:SusC/RagA family TonB-linked outer membrane protein [Pseudoflavitalea sp. G-6-1-2]|uniref:SusC/RagA family TonB-linked outer membrane protein n=1 Tax=Pseudoflavitalea sp. G-6-1-2 TaxID=2728841 RepID=UPI00146C29BA|nr:SusC/RagA family TonB-linked outer membrane protein [Pseudoflavitalea sp. G-6-1-2]NML22886.1 SusC/RagA family TonB-linked outer membrane protein [Pseudoflavitalea sp. G-6-1-2]